MPDLFDELAPNETRGDLFDQITPEPPAPKKREPLDYSKFKPDTALLPPKKKLGPENVTEGGTTGSGFRDTGYVSSGMPEAQDVKDVFDDVQKPGITIPKFTVNPNDAPELAVGKEASNILLSIPEFFTSPLGVASMFGAGVAPKAVSSLFTLDMAHSLGKQVVQTHKDWDKYTPAQQAAAIVDLIGTGAMAGLAAHGAVKGLPEVLQPKPTTTEIPNASEITSSTEVPVRQVREGVGGPPPLQQQGETAGTRPVQEIQAQEAQAIPQTDARQVTPPITPPEAAPVVAPGAKPIDVIQKVLALPTKDLQSAFPVGENNLTRSAWRLGQSLTTPEELQAVKDAQDKSVENVKALQKAGDLNAAMTEAARHQFFNEAYQAATGTGSAGLALAKDPNYKPPFPQAVAPVETPPAPAVKAEVPPSVAAPTVNPIHAEFVSVLQGRSPLYDLRADKIASAEDYLRKHAADLVNLSTPELHPDTIKMYRKMAQDYLDKQKPAVNQPETKPPPEPVTPAVTTPGVETVMPEPGGKVKLSGGDKFHSDISGTVYQVHNNGEVLDVIKDGTDYPVRVTVEDYPNREFGKFEQPKTAPQAAPATPKKGLTMEEAKAHLEEANANRPLGRTWEEINAIQGGKLAPLPKTPIKPGDTVEFEGKKHVVKRTSPDGSRVVINRRSVPASQVRKVEPKVLEPWQATQAQYVKRYADGGNEEQWKKIHGDIVKQAVDAGKPVPPEVLADYPDLATKPATTPQPAAAKPAEIPVKQTEMVDEARNDLTPELKGYQRKTPAKGTPERTAIEEKWAEHRKLTDPIYEQIADLEIKRDRMDRYSKGYESANKKIEKLRDKRQKIDDEYKGVQTQVRDAYREDALESKNPIVRLKMMDDLRMTGQGEKSGYERVKKLMFTEAKKLGATDEEAAIAGQDAYAYTINEDVPLEDVVKRRIEGVRVQERKNSIDPFVDKLTQYNAYDKQQARSKLGGVYYDPAKFEQAKAEILAKHQQVVDNEAEAQRMIKESNNRATSELARKVLAATSENWEQIVQESVSRRFGQLKDAKAAIDALPADQKVGTQIYRFVSGGKPSWTVWFTEAEAKKRAQDALNKIENEKPAKKAVEPVPSGDAGAPERQLGGGSAPLDVSKRAVESGYESPKAFADDYAKNRDAEVKETEEEFLNRRYCTGTIPAQHAITRE